MPESESEAEAVALAVEKPGVSEKTVKMAPVRARSFIPLHIPILRAAQDGRHAGQTVTASCACLLC